jgi:threonine synthase
MWAWESEPHSAADGILDDETYDWVAILDAMADTQGSPVVASESNILRAHELAHSLTDINVSATGSSGLAGLLQIRDEIHNDEKVVVIFSGIDRG